MEGFCRSCLVKFDEPTDLIPYSEKNRRMFVYATGLQVKRNDPFIFQLCKECYLNMKVACNFKKSSRNSDKKFKNFLASKEMGDNVDFCTFLKNNDESLKFRFPMYNGNSTPANRNKDDDNVSTCTSIQNFITDILQAEEIPDSEARIIKEVIEEEADILEDSLDSHWLRDDVSINTDFRMDFSFSPFSTPRSINEDHCYTPKRLDNPIPYQNKPNEIIESNAVQNVQLKSMPDLYEDMKPIRDENVEDIEKCVIDINLENALKNDSKKVMLDKLLATPPIIPNATTPSTPLIKSILFGDNNKYDGETIKTQTKNVYMPTDLIKQKEIDVLYELFKASDDQIDTNEELVQDYDDIYMPDINGLVFIEDPKKTDASEENCLSNEKNYVNETKEMYKDEKNISKTAVENNQVTTTVRPTSPIENKYCLKKMYCKICDRQFTLQRSLKVHFKTKHKHQLELKRRVCSKRMICDHCGQAFRSSKQMVKHIQIHMNPDQYRCDHCPLSFRTENGLKAHKATHGIVDKTTNKTKNRRYVCKLCGASFTMWYNHAVHMRRHAGVPSVCCDVCGRGFYRSCDLRDHMRCHTGERPYGCVYCPKKFVRQDALNRHIKSHTGEKPFKCTICNDKFISAFFLKKHLTRSKRCMELQSKVLSENAGSGYLDDDVTNYAEVFNSEEVKEEMDELPVMIL